MARNRPAFDFDQVIDRRAVPGDKWGRYAGRDVVPMWVADMDFAAPPAIIEALHARLDHRVFGYTDAWPSLIEAVIDGIARDHDWRIEADWLVWLPGVVTGFTVACRMAGEPGDAVLTATPVYPPFLRAPANNQRRLQTVDLVCDGARWQWDWDALDATLDADTRMLLLCHPHNPVGRLFDPRELTALAERAERHDLLVCSDEIHCGLVLDGTHRPIAALDAAVARRSITLMAPSQTWNIPALYASFAILAAAALRGLVATEAAYRAGSAGRLARLDYLRGNRERVMQAIKALPGLRTTRPEATYLAWIDCRDAGLDEPTAFFEKHGVGLSDGRAFGAPPGFVRLNFGCPRSLLDEGLDRMRTALAAST